MSNKKEAVAMYASSTSIVMEVLAIAHVPEDLMDFLLETLARRDTALCLIACEGDVKRVQSTLDALGELLSSKEES